MNLEHGAALRNRFNVVRMPIADLKPDARNPRTHSKRQIEQIAASIDEFGFVNPILIDERNQIIAGHGRLAAAQLLGLDPVPAIRLCHLTEAQKRALALADNKLAENAGWNEEVLAQELHYLSEIEVDFDVAVTGFSTAEIDLRDALHPPLGVDDKNHGAHAFKLVGRGRLHFEDRKTRYGAQRHPADEESQDSPHTRAF